MILFVWGITQNRQFKHELTKKKKRKKFSNRLPYMFRTQKQRIDKDFSVPF